MVLEELQIERIVEDPGNCVMYYIKYEPERVFMKGELVLIPKDTELSPDYVQKWWVKD